MYNHNKHDRLVSMSKTCKHVKDMPGLQHAYKSVVFIMIIHVSRAKLSSACGQKQLF